MASEGQGGEFDAHHTRPGFVTVIAHAQPAFIQTLNFMACRLQSMLVFQNKASCQKFLL